MRFKFCILFTVRVNHWIFFFIDLLCFNQSNVEFISSANKFSSAVLSVKRYLFVQGTGKMTVKSSRISWIAISLIVVKQNIWNEWIVGRVLKSFLVQISFLKFRITEAYSVNEFCSWKLQIHKNNNLGKYSHENTHSIYVYTMLYRYVFIIS